MINKMNTAILQHKRRILDDLKEDIYNLKITKEALHGTYFPGASFHEGYVAGFYSGFDECKKLVVELIRKEMEANNV